MILSLPEFLQKILRQLSVEVMISFFLSSPTREDRLFQTKGRVATQRLKQTGEQATEGE